jgi:trehalose 6-phosphate synthase/trehalose 6-phosphate phosphatase
LTNEAAERLEEFFGGFAPDSSPLLMLDYDGTMAPFRVNRFRARPWAGLREVLNRIQRQGRTRMAVVTGRPAREIWPLLGMETPPEVWGLHGAERLHPDGRREMEPAAPAARATLDELRMRLKRDAFGGLFEDKPNAAVMHWRGVAPQKSALIEKRTRELFEPLAKTEGLRLLEFECGLELRAGRDKGGAVEEILREAGGTEKSFPAAYLGDDYTDEAAFAALNGRGLSVLVRREWRQTGADVWLRPPLELKDFLRKWLEACEGLKVGVPARIVLYGQLDGSQPEPCR